MTLESVIHDTPHSIDASYLECWSPCLVFLPYFPSRAFLPSAHEIVRQTLSPVSVPHLSPCLGHANTYSPLPRGQTFFPNFMTLSGDHTPTSSFPTPIQVFPSPLPWPRCKHALTSLAQLSMIHQFRGDPAVTSLRKARAVFAASQSCAPSTSSWFGPD